ncbi:MAG: Uma2 family endonuclease [Anaerolineae bacterium]|nr:Uma2 family endonuclease [Anaerolineae bacterium]
MTVLERFFTADDLWEFSHRPENEGKRFELNEGILVEMSPAGGKHGGIAGGLFGHIWIFVGEHDLGYVTAAETGFILFKNPDGRDIVRAPDVGFIKADRLPNGLPDGFIPLAPDLAVEVVSPTDEAEEVQAKVNQYLKYGTRLVWVGYPKSKTFMVHTVDGAHSIDIDGTLDGGDVLPGLKIPVRELFRRV